MAVSFSSLPEQFQTTPAAVHSFRACYPHQEQAE